MAAANPFYGEPGACQGTVLADRFHCILAACGGVAACGGEMGRYGALIEADEEDEKFRHINYEIWSSPADSSCNRTTLPASFFNNNLIFRSIVE